MERKQQANRQAEYAQHQQVDRQQRKQTAAGDTDKHGEKVGASVPSP